MTARRVGCVVIGRNEGARLARCLASVALNAPSAPAVYVDSGSADGSAEAARETGVSVVELAPAPSSAPPFTAARARNAGLARLLEAGRVDYVQFIDGDCELLPGWVDEAVRFLERVPEAAVAAGRLRERFPDATIYNRLCDLEWDVPPGPAKACGGIAMMRVAPFLAAGGFRETLAAGEEPELCLRLRAAGWEIRRLDREMAVHDAAMTRFGQWWARRRRFGRAAAEGATLHGFRGPSARERHGVAETARALLWGALLPGAATAAAGVLLALGGGVWALAPFALWPAQATRLALIKWERPGRGGRLSWLWAGAAVLGRFAEALGVLEFAMRRVRR